MKEIETEDLFLLIGIIVAFISTIIDEVNSNIIFKLLKFFAFLISLYLTIQRIRNGKPYKKEVPASAWEKISDGVEIKVLRSEHKRGKTPHYRVMVPNENGNYVEGFVEMGNDGDGNVFFRADEPFPVRIEIRK